eukprot:8204415-Prorocentrum_lima.AAC.1
MIFQEVASKTGDNLRSVQFESPPADVWSLRKLPGMEDYDNYVEILDLLKAMWDWKMLHEHLS